MCVFVCKTHHFSLAHLELYLTIIHTLYTHNTKHNTYTHTHNTIQTRKGVHARTHIHTHRVESVARADNGK